MPMWASEIAKEFLLAVLCMYFSEMGMSLRDMRTIRGKKLLYFYA